MKNSLTFFIYIVITALLFTCYCCSEQKENENIISQAESVVKQHPDSALYLLYSILFPEDLNIKMLNKYNLILLQAKDKCDENITSDTIIFAVKDYYANKKDYQNAALAAFYCGRVLYEQKEKEKATKAYMEADIFADKTDNYYLKGLIKSNMGILQREGSHYDISIGLYKNSIEMFDKVKNYKNKIIALASIGDCFILNNQADSAYNYYNESLQLAELHNITELQSNIKQSMGVLYRVQGQYKLAKKLFNEALDISKDSVANARILINIAKVYNLEKNIDSLIFYFDKALALQINDPWLMRSSYKLRSEIEEKNGRYNEALIYYKDYYRLTTEVFDVERNNKLLEIHEKYDFEKLKNANNQSKIKQQNTVIIFSFGLLATCIIILIFYRKSIQEKRILLETEKKVIEFQKIAQGLSEEKQSFRNTLYQQFNIMTKTALLESEIIEVERNNARNLLKKFNKIVYEQDTLDWNKLYIIMDNLYDGVYKESKEKYPHWDEMTFRIFCLTYDNQFNDTEIAIILKKTVNMVRKIRNVIRKDTNTPKYSHKINI